jgi:hypothetical protein
MPERRVDRKRKFGCLGEIHDREAFKALLNETMYGPDFSP